MALLARMEQISAHHLNQGKAWFASCIKMAHCHLCSAIANSFLLTWAEWMCAHYDAGAVMAALASPCSYQQMPSGVLRLSAMLSSNMPRLRSAVISAPCGHGLDHMLNCFTTLTHHLTVYLHGRLTVVYNC